MFDAPITENSVADTGNNVVTMKTDTKTGFLLHDAQTLQNLIATAHRFPFFELHKKDTTEAEANNMGYDRKLCCEEVFLYTGSTGRMPTIDQPCFPVFIERTREGVKI
ncbi:hypothetical protein Tco_1004979 [Tanacetum coccineum]|uniref:Uncharacterized protein n=1 Tax=Tanacetum coccineum TaxID=301880 RepID=A0ABQ5FDE5_9ASTR